MRPSLGLNRRSIGINKENVKAPRESMLRPSVALAGIDEERRRPARKGQSYDDSGEESDEAREIPDRRRGRDSFVDKKANLQTFGASDMGTQHLVDAIAAANKQVKRGR